LSKPLTLAQAALMRKARGTVKPPTWRDPATELRALSPAERLQERLEAQRLETGWRQRRAPEKGYGGA